MTGFHTCWLTDSRQERADHQAWDQWKERVRTLGHGGLVDEIEQCGEVSALLAQTCAGSPFLSGCLAADIDFTNALLREGADTALATSLAQLAGDGVPGEESRDAIMDRLRIGKRNAALTMALADIAGAWPTMKLAEAASELAVTALGVAVRHLLAEADAKGRLSLPDRAQPDIGSGLTIIGMGKLGAGELNFSSDIDIIILFDETSEVAEAGSHQRVFSRLARDLVSIMAKRTARGYVFRTDLRLRPDPGSTPPAVSMRAASEYYPTVGQTWERAAMIKARPVAGDPATGQLFIDSIQPFIWHRNLDFMAMRGIRAVKRQINAVKGSGSEMAGRSVKLGRGGIREIEFFAQAQQLVWGGQSEALRSSSTLGILDTLAELRHAPAHIVSELKAAYLYLRRVEHRLQMVEDRQTHSLPETQDAIDRVAHFLDYRDNAEFFADLGHHLAIVEHHYDRLFESPVPVGDDLMERITTDPETASDALCDLGFANPERAARQVRAWPIKDEGLYAETVPILLRAFSSTAEPDAALDGFCEFLASQRDASATLATLIARPDLVELIAEVMGATPRLAAWIRVEPRLIESVLQREVSDLELPDDIGLEPAMLDSARRGLVRVHYTVDCSPAALTEELTGTIGDLPASDLQPILDRQRRWRRRRMFVIGCHILRGHLSPVEASQPLSAIAQACLASLIPIVEEQFRTDHGTIIGGSLAVVAFGKFGSCEMTFASDLDLIFVYDHAPDAPASDGSKPLAPSQYFARLCRRIINAITARTREGSLYEVDMRLRPSGKSGPIACSLTAFESYQLDQAWTWEQQALTRARVIYAESHLEERLRDIMRRALVRDRDPAQLAEDVRSMRQRMRNEQKGTQATSIKHRPGGLLDIEFIAQFIQLRHASEHPDILLRDVHSVLERAGQAELLPAADAKHLADAAVFWRNLHGMLLLAGGNGEDLSRSIRHAAGRSCGPELIASMETATADAETLVADAFARLVAA